MIALVRGVIAFSIASAVMRKFSASFGLKVHNLAAGILDDVFEGDPVRHRQNYFVAVVYQHLDDVEERQLAAGGKHGLVDRVVRSEIAGMPLDNRLAQLWNAGHDGVASEVRLKRGNRGVLDVAGCSEMRLARSKIHHVRSLGTELGGFGGYGHRGGDFDPPNAIGKELGGG